MLKSRNILEKDFLNWCIYLQTQKYTWSRLLKLMYLCINSKLYKKYIFHFDVFLFKLWSILEVVFQYWYIYFETLKYTWSRLSKLMYLSANSEVYLKYTSFQQKSRSINEVLLKYKQSIFLSFSAFILQLYFLLGSSLKACFYWTSRIRSINEVYTSHTVFSVYFC